MTRKQLDQLAKQDQPLPTQLIFFETSYYLAARYLYRQFDKGEITLEQARKEKEQVLEQFEENKLLYEYLLKTHHVLQKLKELKEQGFDSNLEWEILEMIEKL
ncbi:MAG: hypothetical protein RR887_13545 [Niameybacter sp.]